MIAPPLHRLLQFVKLRVQCALFRQPALRLALASQDFQFLRTGIAGDEIAVDRRIDRGLRQANRCAPDNAAPVQPRQSEPAADVRCQKQGARENGFDRRTDDSMFEGRLRHTGFILTDRDGRRNTKSMGDRSAGLNPAARCGDRANPQASFGHGSLPVVACGSPLNTIPHSLFPNPQIQTRSHTSAIGPVVPRGRVARRFAA